MSEKETIGTLRKPFYEMQDGLRSLTDAIRETDKVELINMVEHIQEAVSELERRMSQELIWD